MTNFTNNQENAHNSNKTVAASAMPSRARGFSREHEGGANAAYAPPSNRAYTNATLTVLRYGVDSLFLSFMGALHPKVLEELKVLKALAQDDDRTQQAKAQIKVLDHIFEVTDKGSRGFSFGLLDNAFLIKLGKSDRSMMPFAYVQVSSDYLAHVGCAAAFAECRAVISGLGVIAGEEKISRIDLFADFTCDFDFSSLSRRNLVGRSNKINWREEKMCFTGFDVGLKGKVAFRLYNKTIELTKKPRPYLHELWKANGWDGKGSVWRAEFETKRKYLRHSGVDTVDFFCGVQHIIWEYLTHDWLRVVQAKESDSHRERSKTYPWWLELHDCFNHGQPRFPLEKFDFSRIPSDQHLFQNGFAGLTSFMARHSIENPNEALRKMMVEAHRWHRERSNHKSTLEDYLGEKAAEKKRRFNKLISSPSSSEDSSDGGVHDE